MWRRSQGRLAAGAAAAAGTAAAAAAVSASNAGTSLRLARLQHADALLLAPASAAAAAAAAARLLGRADVAGAVPQGRHQSPTAAACLDDDVERVCSAHQGPVGLTVGVRGSASALGAVGMIGAVGAVGLGRSWSQGDQRRPQIGLSVGAADDAHARGHRRSVLAPSPAAAAASATAPSFHVWEQKQQQHRQQQLLAVELEALWSGHCWQQQQQLQQRRGLAKKAGRKGGQGNGADAPSDAAASAGSAAGGDSGSGGEGSGKARRSQSLSHALERGDAHGGEGAAAFRDLLRTDVSSTIVVSNNELDRLFAEGLPPRLAHELSGSVLPGEREPSAVTGRGATARAAAATDAHIVVRQVTKAIVDHLSQHGKAVQQQQQQGKEAEAAEAPADAVGTSPALPRCLLLQGPPGSGKSYALLSAAAWARANGWVVLYVPRARDWTAGGVYYRHGDSKLWDTPMQAQTVLKSFLAGNAQLLAGQPIRILQTLALGELPGGPAPKGGAPGSTARVDPNWSLKDLAQYGADHLAAATSVVVRLREELCLVKGTPVLIAVDEWNAWHTFASYFESTGERSRRQIHANELRMVNAFRSLEAGPSAVEGVDGSSAPTASPVVVVGAFSETIAVGRLPHVLPGLPHEHVMRVGVDRLSIAESRAIIANHFARRDGEMPEDLPDDVVLRLHFLTAGNGIELRKLALMM